MLYILIGFVIGFISWLILDFVFSKYVFKERPIGKLIIDHQSIPEEEPYLFFQSYVNPSALIDKQTVIVEVSTEKFISHE